MKILNLYAGIGGNRKLWGDEHEVTAVEDNKDIAEVYSKLYPNDLVVVDDAHEYLLKMYDAFDFIWSSPPCPSHSRMRTSLVKSKPVYPDMKLWQEIYFLTHFFKGKWVVENVVPYYKPFLQPQDILDRHMIWANFPVNGVKFERGYKGRVTDQTKETLAKEYGIDLPQGTINQRKLLRNAVNPQLGLHLLNQAQVEQGVLL